MFRELRIKSYRGLHEITMSQLERINIIIGENNSGKTSILEVLQLFDNRDILSNIITIAKRRESQLGMVGARNRLNPFDMLLYSFAMQDDFKEIYVEADSDEYGRSRVGICGRVSREIGLPEDSSKAEAERYMSYCDEDETIRVLRGEYIYECSGHEQGKYYFNETQRVPSIDSEYGMVKKSGSMAMGRMRRIQYISPMDIYTNKVISASLYKGMLVEEKRILLELLRMFDERIVGVETGVQYGSPVTFIEMEDCGLVPISVFGDGLKKVMTLASVITRMRGGVVLIDEFETGIHKRALIQVARWLATVTEKYDVQVFLTTHSSEAIDALVEAQDNYKNINAYRLEHYKSNIYVKQFQGTDLHRLKADQGMDIL